MADKQTLRKTYLRKRKELALEEFSRRNSALHHNLFPLLSEWEVKYVHTFLSIAQNREVDTWPIVDFLTRHRKKVVVSKSELDTNVLSHFLFEGKDSLINNRWGIPEPQAGVLVNEKKIDLVFVPLLAFDQSGHRVGYGKGYYDRFLKNCRQDVLKVGLSILQPVQQISDVDTHDIPLDFCVTHDEVYKF